MLYKYHTLAYNNCKHWSNNFVSIHKDYLYKNSKTALSRFVVGLSDIFLRITHESTHGDFEINSTVINGRTYPILQSNLINATFCDLKHFYKLNHYYYQPKVLLVAPLSGHFTTLIKKTISVMLPEHDVYVLDWKNARDIPLDKGYFDFNTYIDYMLSFIKNLGSNLHILGICQSAVPVLAATAILAQQKHLCAPSTITLMGGPIDTRINPTSINTFAKSHDIDWFKKNMIQTVPAEYKGANRLVYPGFMQLTSFINMHLDMHINSICEYLKDCINNNSDKVRKHKKFYDEYMNVLDIDAKFYLETVDEVFHKHSLATEQMKYYDTIIDCNSITKSALMTIEGGKDDICGVGQTYAAHRICGNLSEKMKYHYLQNNVGHYGLFSGSKWEHDIYPQLKSFIKKHDRR